MSPIVSQLWVYPVKGCRGIAVREAAVTPRGFAGDRRWMLVDPTGRFVSQREEPRLARVATALDERSITLRCEGAAPFALPRELERGVPRSVVVWRSRVEALEHLPAREWLRAAIGRELALVYMPDASERAIDPDYAHPGDIVSFADGFPLLVIGESSLDALNAKLDAPVEMRRFRPSLVVAGTAAHAEDAARTMRVGGVELRLVKPCSRCVVPTLDPDTGEAGPEPLRTLKRYRTVGTKVLFGMNAIPSNTGTVRVGEPIECVPDVE